MGDKILPDGTYVVMGAGGHIVMPSHRMGPGGIVLLPPNRSDKTQQWTVKFNAGSYTLQNVATGSYLGSDDAADGPVLLLDGTAQPVAWELVDGPDDDPDSYILISANSDGNLMLAPSPIRIFPPQLAILPPRAQYPYEWTFTQVELSGASLLPHRMPQLRSNGGGKAETCTRSD